MSRGPDMAYTHRRSRKRLTDPGTCNTCHRPMRDQYTKAADKPGTVIRSGPGICSGCRNKTRKEQPTPVGAPDPTLAAWRIVYEADRRNRGIPPEGTFQ